MPKVKFSLSFHPNRSIRELANIAELAERKGCFDTLWIADENPVPSFRDVFASLTAIALETSRIAIGPGITIPFNRHPTLIAVACASLEEVITGRVVLGLGRGGSGPLRMTGADYRNSIGAMREAVSIIRMLLEGKKVDEEGQYFKGKGSQVIPKPMSRIPIYLAARGPRMLGLAGEIADGVLVQTPAATAPYAMEAINQGLNKVGKASGSVDIANFVVSSISKSAPGSARKAVRSHISWMVVDSPPIVRESLGIKDKEIENLKSALALGPDEASEYVTERMIDGFSASGSISDCIESISEYLSEGCAHIVFSNPKPDPYEAIELLAEEVVPSF